MHRKLDIDKLARTLTGWVGVCALAVGFSLIGFLDARAQGAPVKDRVLVERIEQLEEQIVDMQVVIGTLQSLPSGAGALAPAPPIGGFTSSGGGANDAARLDGMETQIRALSAQVAQLAQQMRGLNAGGARRGAVEGGYPQQPVPPVSPVSPTTRPSVGRAGETGAVSGFGSTTVQPNDLAGGGSIEGLLREPDNGRAVASVEREPQPPAGPAPKKLYETAYGYLLQQQYGAAKSAFQDFLKIHPNDPLAGNAQYWLGESFYVQGQYKSAAAAFLKGYETYSKSNKAPDSLLKLAMSLERLGQKDAACSSLSELNSRFPAAPVHVKKRALSEGKRVGC